MSNNEIRRRFQAAAAEPSAPLDFPVVLERGLRRRRRQRGAPAVLTATVVVAAAVAIPLAVLSRGPGEQVLHGTPAAPSWKGSASPGAHVPAGWQAVTYGDLQIAVPGSWRVVDEGGSRCPVGSTTAVALGTPGATGGPCPASLRYLVSVQEAPASLSTGGTVSTIDGVAVATTLSQSTSSPFVRGPDVSYVVPAFHVELTVSAAWAHSVVATVSPSARAVVARGGLLPYTPSQWTPVDFGGVTLRVPPTWPLLSRGPFLCNDLAPWTSSQANVGPAPQVYCNTPPAQQFVPGVWVFASSSGPPASWGKVVGTFPVSGGTVQVFAGDPAATWVPVLVTPSGHGSPVGLWLGVGVDGALARDVLGSIQVTGP